MSESTEKAKLRPINGTDLAYKLCWAGAVKNMYDSRAETIREDLGWAPDDNKDRRLRNIYCYKIYIRNGRSIEELEEALSRRNKDGHIERPHMVEGDLLFSSERSVLTVDINGNLLLRGAMSDLGGVKIPGGDVLISGEGRLLRVPSAGMFIHEADDFGFYPVDVSSSKTNYYKNKTDILPIKKNFLDQNGRLISAQHFECTDKPMLVAVSRTYNDGGEGKAFIHKGIYPTAYVYTDSDGVRLYPSATALLMSNRNLLADNPNATPLIDDETPYIEEYFARQTEIYKVQSELYKKWKKGTLSDEKFERAMTAMEYERDMREVFEAEFITERDLAIKDRLMNESASEMIDD